MLIIVIVAIYIFLHMFGAWGVYRLTNNPSVVDVAWGLGLMVSGLIYLWSQPMNARLIVISSLLILWGVRLSGYIWYTRIRKGIVDKRYLKLSEDWKIARPLGFFLNFELQGLFILIMSSVFFFAATQTYQAFSILDVFGVCLVLIGIIGESVADWQLHRFQSSHKAEVCKAGLWSYSRHPNYFFEWVVWCGFAVFGLKHTFGCVGLLSPLVLYYIMTRITGPLTEKGSLVKRGEAYLLYQRQTPMFFPFKKLLNR